MHQLLFFLIVAVVPLRPSNVGERIVLATRTGQSSGQSQTSDHEEAESHVLSFRSEMREVGHVGHANFPLCSALETCHVVM